MQHSLLIVVLTISLFVSSCTKTRTADKQATTQTELSESKTENLVKTTLTNHEGTKLERTFNNARQTATLVLNGEVIELKQDTVASGINYSNAHYEYREHQGEIILTKDGKAVFAYKK